MHPLVVQVTNGVFVDLVCLYYGFSAAIKPREALAHRRHHVYQLDRRIVGIVNQELTDDARSPIGPFPDIDGGVPYDFVGILAPHNNGFVFFLGGIQQPPLVELVDVLNNFLARHHVVLVCRWIHYPVDGVVGL